VVPLSVVFSKKNLTLLLLFFSEVMEEDQAKVNNKRRGRTWFPPTPRVAQWVRSTAEFSGGDPEAGPSYLPAAEEPLDLGASAADFSAPEEFWHPCAEETWPQGGELHIYDDGDHYKEYYSRPPLSPWSHGTEGIYPPRMLLEAPAMGVSGPQDPNASNFHNFVGDEATWLHPLSPFSNPVLTGLAPLAGVGENFNRLSNQSPAARCPSCPPGAHTCPAGGHVLVPIVPNNYPGRPGLLGMPLIDAMRGDWFCGDPWIPNPHGGDWRLLEWGVGAWVPLPTSHPDVRGFLDRPGLPVDESDRPDLSWMQYVPPWRGSGNLVSQNPVEQYHDTAPGRRPPAGNQPGPEYPFWVPPPVTGWGQASQEPLDGSPAPYSGQQLFDSASRSVARRAVPLSRSGRGRNGRSSRRSTGPPPAHSRAVSPREPAERFTRYGSQPCFFYGEDPPEERGSPT
jgi:hypothetical protein